jgi:hypothetical protein
MIMTIQQEVENFARDLKEEKISPKYILGAFGDTTDKSDTGIIAEEIRPEKGTYIRFLGCSYLFKTCPFGNIPTALIELYTMPKRLLSRTIIDIQKDKLLLATFLFYFFIRRKKFLEYLNYYSNTMYNAVLGYIILDEERFNTFHRELRRVNEIVFNNNHRLSKPLKKIFEIIIYLIDFDSAYRWALQDVLSIVDKKNEPRKEFLRLINIAIERYNDEQVKNKLRALKKLHLIFLLPYYKKMITTFLQELDTEKIKFDEDDNYFILKRKLYNFNGLDFATRLKERQRLDKEKGHIPINVNLDNIELYG